MNATCQPCFEMNYNQLSCYNQQLYYTHNSQIELSYLKLTFIYLCQVYLTFVSPQNSDVLYVAT